MSEDEPTNRSRTNRSPSGVLAASLETSKTGQKIGSNIDPSKNQRDIVAPSDDWLQVSPAFLDISTGH